MSDERPWHTVGPSDLEAGLGTGLKGHPFSNRFLFVAVAAALSLHAGALYLPATQFVLRVEPLEVEAWVRMAVVALSVIAAMELHKLVRRRHAP